MQSIKTKKLVNNALLASLYVALTLINPISSGIFQFRVSTLLVPVPFYQPKLAPGILLGVMISNVFSPLGPIDILSGFLIQSVTLYIFNRIFTSAYIKSIAYGIWCGIMVGATLHYAVGAPFWISAFSVAISNIVVAIIGTLIIEKKLSPLIKKLAY